VNFEINIHLGKYDEGIKVFPAYVDKYAKSLVEAMIPDSLIWKMTNTSPTTHWREGAEVHVVKPNKDEQSIQYVTSLLHDRLKELGGDKYELLDFVDSDGQRHYIMRPKTSTILQYIESQRAD